MISNNRKRTHNIKKNGAVPDAIGLLLFFDCLNKKHYCKTFLFCPPPNAFLNLSPPILNILRVPYLYILCDGCFFSLCINS